MIWIRLILAAFLGAACSLVGGGAGMIRGAVLFVLLTSGDPGWFTAAGWSGRRCFAEAWPAESPPPFSAGCPQGRWRSAMFR